MLRRTRRLFAQLPDKKEVKRPLTDCEHGAIEMKNSFGRSGIFRNQKITEAMLYQVWKKAKPGSYDDFAAGCYGMNLFYNFGRRMGCKQMTDRFLQLCVTTEQYDQGIDTLKYYKGQNQSLNYPRDQSLQEFLGVILCSTRFQGHNTHRPSGPAV